MTMVATCPVCSTRYGVRDEHAGKKLRCPKCREVLVAPPAPPPKPEPPPVQESPKPVQGGIHQAGEPVPQLWPNVDGLAPQALLRVLGVRSTLLGLAGIGLLLAALLVNIQLNDSDAREERIQSSLTRFDLNLTGRSEYRPTKKSDRTPVYLLAGGGILCLALAVVCLPSVSGPPAAPPHQ
jgi:predicted Zn finger-like uncharacterized protein